MDPPRLQQALDELEEATRDHEAWYRELMRSIVCRVSSGADETGPDCHLQCRFGEWYYGRAQTELREQRAYTAIEAEHKRLHRLAARVLQASASNQPISTEDYDELVAGSARLRLELGSLRQQIEAALRNRDPLTGAVGRVEILPALREAAELGRRGVQQACVAFMDLDRFKDINDRHGHRVGDEVLVGAVRYVAAHLRSYDRLFRYGGDEFLILLPGVHVEVAHRLVERLRAGMAETVLASTEAGLPIRVTASFGLTPLESDLTAEEFVDRADKALLVAKAAGRNRVIRWDPSVTTARLEGGATLANVVGFGAGGSRA
jgi:diguanylate cyclase (GGDEF)-like protein